MSLVAIVGRPNVGKSTLFNRLVGQRKAIVDATAGTTRDRHYGKTDWNGKEFSVIDTGGYTVNSEDIFEDEIRRQVLLAIDEADVILFLVEVATGITDLDQLMADILRRTSKKVILVCNKVDNNDQIYSSHEFYALGLGDPFCISSMSGSGTGDLMDAILAALPAETVPEEDEDLPHITIVGRPNVGKQVNVPVYEHGTQDPVKTALEAVERARYLGRDVLIIDTAGRLHIDQELMDELVRIKENVHPQEILLVVDAMTGQDAVNVAQTFNEKLDIDGVILTKLDGDTRGGAALSVRAVTGKPIKFSGTGEKLSEIEPFHPDRMASRILGMGDVLTLIDKASEAFDQEDAEKLAKKARTADLTLDDFLDQMQSMKKMGGIKSMLEMLPGMSGKDIDVDENAMKKPEAIIRSMTPKERRNPGVLNASRRKRIAAGSGTTVQDVNQLIRQFDQAKQMMKQVTQMKGKGRMRMRFPGMR